MQLFFIGIGIFLITVITIELIFYSIRNASSVNSIKIRRRLKNFTYDEFEKNGSDILKKEIYSDIPLFNSLLSIIPGIQKINSLVDQANGKQSIGFYILVSLILASLGFFIGMTIFVRSYQASLLVIPFGYLPFLYLTRLKRKRIEKFKKQLPDGLDLMARSLKAGHAFSGGMKMTADEFDDPLGPEFAKTIDEINFGVSVEEALKNLAGRIDCQELRYFVVAVILQRETGGNLAELIETLANLIREKFKFDGKVRTLSAEGKFSAVVLILLPFFVFGYLWMTNPNFLQPLLAEPIGNHDFRVYCYDGYRCFNNEKYG
jgi:tight adherence protein B